MQLVDSLFLSFPVDSLFVDLWCVIFSFSYSEFWRIMLATQLAVALLLENLNLFHSTWPSSPNVSLIEVFALEIKWYGKRWCISWGGEKIVVRLVSQNTSPVAVLAASQWTWFAWHCDWLIHPFLGCWLVDWYLIKSEIWETRFSIIRIFFSLSASLLVTPSLFLFLPLPLFISSYLPLIENQL